MPDPKKNITLTFNKRLEAIKLAGEIGVSEACRRTGIDRTSFYKWEARYRQFGLPGLINRLPIVKESSHKMTSEKRNIIYRSAMTVPNFGCDKLSKYIEKNYNLKISPPTIQKFLNFLGLKTREERKDWAVIMTSFPDYDYIRYAVLEQMMFDHMYDRYG